MESVANKISQLYIETFTLEKVREDLFSHLNTNINELFIRNEVGYVLDAYIELEEDKYESVTICEDDEITILHYQSFLDSGSDFQFNVIIGIGEFVENQKGNLAFSTIEKCLAKLRYNSDLSSYDVEFFIDENHREKVSKS